MKEVKFEDLFDYEKKSKIKAGDGLPYTEGEYPFFTSSNTLSKSINQFQFEEPRLIFGTGGQASLHFFKNKFAVSTDCLVAKPKKEQNICVKYYYYFLIQNNMRLLEEGFKGAGLKHISRKYINKIKIPLPPLETQKRIAEILDNAAVLRDKTEQLLEEYDALAQSIFLDMFGDPVINPKGWETKKVEEICLNIIGGGTPKRSVAEYFNGDIPWVTPKDMKKLLIGNSKIKITKEAIKESSAKLIPKNAILMVIRSGILKKKLPVAVSTEIVTINQDMKAFIVNDRIINFNYLLYYFLNSETFLLSKVRAVTADNIEFKQIKNLNIPLPKLELQNEFAEKIALIEKQKELAHQELKESEDLFNALLQKAFKGELV